MMKKIMFLFVSLAMAGCARLNTSPEFIPADRMESSPPYYSETKTEKAPLNTYPPIEITDYDKKAWSQKPKLRPDIVVDNANKGAKQAPQSGDYINSIVRYDYAEGIIYQVYTSPKHITDIRLEEGEAVNGSPCAGDTSNWSIVHTVSGSGKNTREHLIVKPFKPGLETNLIITTNKRTYYLEIKSFNETYMAGVSWTYPNNQMENISSKTLRKSIGENISLDNLNFDYKIKISGDALYKPVSVFDDTEKTYIQFSPKISQRELPPLFVLTDGKETQLVNYRYSVERHCYVVDCIFEAAMLKIGSKRKQAVYIYNLSLKRKSKDL